jgi:hypothetical protein
MGSRSPIAEAGAPDARAEKPPWERRLPAYRRSASVPPAIAAADRLPSAVLSLRAFPLLVLRHGYARHLGDLVTRG